MDKYEIGIKYHYLTILEELEPKMRPNGRKRRMVLVKCDCGNEKVIIAESLTAKHNGTMSCGCYHKKVMETGKFSKKYEHSKHSLYIVWNKIKERCYSNYSPSFKNYGGRGITMCDSWLNDYEIFYEWSIKNGYKRSLQIDRINNDGDYSPDNCRFVTPKINGNNKRNNIIIDYNKLKDNLPNTLGRLGIFNKRNYKKVWQRLNAGWSFENSIRDLI